MSTIQSQARKKRSGVVSKPRSLAETKRHLARTPEPSVNAFGEPAWEIAYLFPSQGTWTESEYLDLPGNRLVELSNGFLEVLPMPTTSHQKIVLAFYRALLAFAGLDGLGTVLVAALRVRLWKGKFREPDVVFMLAEHADRIGEEYWQGADLAMEVVRATTATANAI